jgi:hypothetical protein
MRSAAVLLAVLTTLAGCGTPAPPGTSTTGPTGGDRVSATVGDVVGYYTIDQILPDRLEGFYNQPYPVATSGPGQPRTLRIGEDVGAACEGRTYTLVAIDAARQTATFQENEFEPPPGGCPICLAAGTRIATPDGDVAVEDVRVGMVVWSLRDGERVAAPVEEVGRAAAVGHAVVDLRLEDGRALHVSPGHPLLDGRPVGLLRAGDMVDGSRIASAALIPYEASHTYDLRAGDGYWANGIPMGSTLRGP